MLNHFLKLEFFFIVVQLISLRDITSFVTLQYMQDTLHTLRMAKKIYYTCTYISIQNADSVHLR